MKSKLLRVEREINVYKKNIDDPFKEINIDNIPFDTLKTIVVPKEDDPLLYDGYILNELQIAKLNILLENKIIPDLIKFFYVLECTGIYEYEKE